MQTMFAAARVAIPIFRLVLRGRPAVAGEGPTRCPKSAWAVRVNGRPNRWATVTQASLVGAEHCLKTVAQQFAPSAAKAAYFSAVCHAIRFHHLAHALSSAPVDGPGIDRIAHRITKLEDQRRFANAVDIDRAAPH